MEWIIVLKTPLAASIGLAALTTMVACSEGHDDWDHRGDPQGYHQNDHHDDPQNNQQDNHHSDAP